MEEAFPPQTKWVKAEKKRWVGTSGLGRVLILPPPLPLNYHTPNISCEWSRAGEKTKILLFGLQAFNKYLLNFFSLSSIVIEILYKASFLTEGIYNLLGETKFVKRIREYLRPYLCSI